MGKVRSVAQGFRGVAELVAEGAGQRLMRAIARGQRHMEQVFCPARHQPGRLGQAAAAQIGARRHARGQGKAADQLKPRQAAKPGRLVKGGRLKQVALKEPEGLGQRGLGRFHGPP
jgi:hypothetical protein